MPCRLRGFPPSSGGSFGLPRQDSGRASQPCWRDLRAIPLLERDPEANMQAWRANRAEKPKGSPSHEILKRDDSKDTNLVHASAAMSSRGSRGSRGNTGCGRNLTKNTAHSSGAPESDASIACPGRQSGSPALAPVPGMPRKRVPGANRPCPGRTRRFPASPGRFPFRERGRCAPPRAGRDFHRVSGT